MVATFTERIRESEKNKSFAVPERRHYKVNTQKKRKLFMNGLYMLCAVCAPLLLLNDVQFRCDMAQALRSMRFLNTTFFFFRFSIFAFCLNFLQCPKGDDMDKTPTFLLILQNAAHFYGGPECCNCLYFLCVYMLCPLFLFLFIFVVSWFSFVKGTAFGKRSIYQRFSLKRLQSIALISSANFS